MTSEINNDHQYRDSLTRLYAAWEKWSKSAEKAEDGWESDFPAWDTLILSASLMMRKGNFILRDFRYVEACWIISEESEALADYAKEHVEDCWEALMFLVDSPFWNVRWQVYTVLGVAGSRAEQILRVGLEDPDAYCRRRAILSLANLRPVDIDKLTEQIIGDQDPYIRLVAIDLVRQSVDKQLRLRVKERLLGDGVVFVRDAANDLEID